MIKEARGFGLTIDEAKENAILNLNASADQDIQFEVISTPKKKTFGLFGGCKAQVRVYIELPDEKPKAEKKPLPKQQSKPSKKPIETKKTAAQKPVSQQKVTAEKPVQEKAVQKAAPLTTAYGEGYGEPVNSETLNPETQAAKAVKYLKDILLQLGCENIKIMVAEKENGALITLDGDKLGVVIGHRGDTLDSLQYLTGLAANNGGGYYKVSLNIGNYREKREQTLISLAKRVSEQVIKSNRSRSLEPMNPYERRIIHTAVQDIEGVVSNSFGEGNNRRVVIAPEGGDIRPPRRDDRRDDRRDNNRDNRGSRGRSGYDRDRKPNNTVATAPTREPKKDSDIPLYGKIN